MNKLNALPEYATSQHLARQLGRFMDVDHRRTGKEHLRLPYMLFEGLDSLYEHRESIHQREALVCLQIGEERRQEFQEECLLGDSICDKTGAKEAAIGC